jgi:1-pyrroline-5-carboxylate dehydrogenase
MTTRTGSAGPAGPSREPGLAAPAGRNTFDAAPALAEVRATAHDMRLVIGSQERGSGRTMPVVTPHEYKVTLGRVHYAGAVDVTDAIEAAAVAHRWPM